MPADERRDRLQMTLGSAYTTDRELGGGGMRRVFVARDVAGMQPSGAQVRAVLDQIRRATSHREQERERRLIALRAVAPAHASTRSSRRSEAVWPRRGVT